MKFNFGTGTAGMILLAASLLFLWFVILSGLTNVTPFNKTYFLEADTSGISGARDMTHWTYFWTCDGHNRNCGSPHAAPAFGNAWSRDASNVPSGLGGSKGGHTTSSYIYHIWRATWVFFIMTLFFEAIAFVSSLISCFGRFGSLLANLACFIALPFATIAVCLMTATFVKARNYFHDANRHAKLGRWAFGFAWASLVSLFLAWILFGLGFWTSRSGYKSRKGRTVSTEKRSGNPWRTRNTSAMGHGRRVQESYA